MTGTPKRRHRWWWGLWLLPICVAWFLCAHWGILDFVENRTIDWRFRYRGEIEAPIRIVYVDIDSQSISEIGGFPWSRSYFARVAEALVTYAHVKAVGIDVVFSENGIAEAIDFKKRVEGNRELARFLTTSPPVVVAASYAAAVDRDINGGLIYRDLPRVENGVKSSRSLPELPSFRINEKKLSQQWSPGLIGLIDTMDGATRLVPAYAETEVRPFFHLSIELARLYYGIPDDGIKVSTDAIELVRAGGARAARIPLVDRQLMEVNWFSAWDSPRNPRISLSTVFNYASMMSGGTEEEKKTASEFFSQPDFADAVVLIGPVDPLLQDLSPTSFDETPVPKVGVHGNLLKMIVSGKYLQRLPQWHGVAWCDLLVTLVLATAVTALAVTGGARSWTTKLCAALVLVGYVGFTFWIFKSQSLILPLILPVGAGMTTSFGAITFQLVREERQKGRIKGMFGTYVSPQLVERLVESGQDPQLGGHESEITAYFSDIQSFSAFSEKLESGPLVELMNEYLTACTDILQEEGGTLDKYIGDAVVAMFGAPIALPDHAFRACVASQRVHRKIIELRRKWEAEGSKWPDIVTRMQSRIGLNTGLATIGNMGSRTRFNYTMMGDNVNLAARMESGAKAYGVYTMVTDSTKAACERFGAGRLVFRFLDRIVVKGRTQPVPVFEIVGLEEDVSDATRECLRLFDAGMQAYLSKDWSHATTLLEQSARLEPNQPGQQAAIETNPSLVLLARCRQMMEQAPAPDWDGTHIMKDK